MRIRFLALLASALLSAPALAADDKTFVEKAASGGIMEVKLGEHAAANAAHPDVRAFGKRMAADHGKANQELATVAKAQGIAVPSVMNEEHAKMALDLMAKSGAAFDGPYMEMMVADHEKDVAAFQAQAKDGETDVDRWAAKTVPTLESHLAQARDIEKKLGDTQSGAMR
jgi:putative membrane protein